MRIFRGISRCAAVRNHAAIDQAFVKPAMFCRLLYAAEAPCRSELSLTSPEIRRVYQLRCGGVVFLQWRR
jgi:hypothetical protein